MIGKARQAAKSARLLLEAGDTDGACNRVYYGMFEAAKAALAAIDPQFEVNAIRTHGGLISAFSLQLVKPGQIPIDLGRSLNKVEEPRLIADYRGESIDASSATWAVDQASLFVEYIDNYISNLSSTDPRPN